MSVIVIPGTTIEASSARIGYANLLEQGAVVASSENADYPVANAYDWLTTDYYRPAASGTVTITLTLGSAKSANYMAFYAQDVWKYAGSIKLQYWDGAAWQDATLAITPNSNAPRMVFFDTINATQWRVSITCGTIFNLGAIAFGECVTLPYGTYLNWTPPELARANTAINSVSERGSFLGRSILSSGVKTTLNLNQASDAWTRETWMPFIKHAETKPFWFAHNITKYPTESVFCWAEGDISPPTHTGYGYMSQSIAIRGLVE